MLKFPANFPPSHNFPQALTNSKTLGSSSLHIWMRVFPYMELIAVLEVRAILSVRSLLSRTGVMELTVEEVREKIKEKYSEEVAKKFEGEIS